MVAARERTRIASAKIAVTSGKRDGHVRGSTGAALTTRLRMPHLQQFGVCARMSRAQLCQQ